MATVYKTPGVYVEEIPKLPPSIAQVETAIPAFVGYTEKATEILPNDLLQKPKRIGSLVEYEQFYGKGPSPTVTEINVGELNNFISAKVSFKLFMYDSLRMYFANGGGDCYITSVGNYNATIDGGDLTDGLDEISKEDEPTMLLFPDAVSTTGNSLYDVQVAALTQSSDLQDRVAILDLKENDSLGAEFRGQIGINFLSYGAAYTPWLKVALPKNVKYPDLVKSPSIIKKNGVSVALSDITSDADVLAQIADTSSIYADVANINQRTNLLSLPNGNLWDEFHNREDAFDAANNDGNLQSLFQYAYDVAAQIDGFINGGAAR